MARAVYVLKGAEAEGLPLAPQAARKGQTFPAPGIELGNGVRNWSG